MLVVAQALTAIGALLELACTLALETCTNDDDDFTEDDFTEDGATDEDCVDEGRADVDVDDDVDSAVQPAKATNSALTNTEVHSDGTRWGVVFLSIINVSVNGFKR
ncbi:MAG: hypothetical protein U5M23_10630 [Marinagarivorans sp.]|nr:hypothetical protein [Marinagarivorans sp.]